MRYLTFALTKGRLAKKTLEMLEVCDERFGDQPGNCGHPEFLHG